MILTAHQPCYLPWLGLFAKIAQADTFVLLDTVQYQPRDYNNRNQIWTLNGPHWLTVPVFTKGHRDKPFTAIEINNTLPWQRKHWKAIEQSYRKATHFDEHYYFFHGLYHGGTWRHLSELNDYVLKHLLKMLGISVNYLRASAYKFTGTKADLVLDMCKQLGSSTYLFGAQGKSYVSEENLKAFERAGIEVKFQDYQHPIYSQFGGPFVSYLSVIDLLFHHGPKAKEILMT